MTPKALADLRHKPRLLDLFCGAGGAGYGYMLAGFDVTGVDVVPQPRYPFPMIVADVMSIDWRGFDVIHASPPCQPHIKGLRAVNEKLGREMKHADLIAPIRERLLATGRPYVIENSMDAPLIDPVRVCGTGFGLPLRRHRGFESNISLEGMPCAHGSFTDKRYWTSWRPGGLVTRATTVQVYGAAAEMHEWPAAMGIDWMKNDELREAIPPAYTEHIGKQLLEAPR